MHLLGSLGLLLIVLGEALSFVHILPWSQYVFPLFWYGYILVLDSLNHWRRGHSLISSRPGEFLLMLPISAFYWQIFEWYNVSIQNWLYINAPPEKWLELTTKIVSFATVIPAVYETTDILGAMPWTKRAFRISCRLPADCPKGALALGLILSLLPSLLPDLFFWSIWVGPFLLLDAINHLRDRPSLLRDWQAGDIGRTLVLLTSGYVCGFFWEFWNYWAYTKWIYTVPIPDMPHIFEMPLLGFFGFGLFGLETFAFWTLVWGEKTGLKGRSSSRPLP